MFESDNPESPSFHKKTFIVTNQKDTQKQFDDISFWSNKPRKLIELDDAGCAPILADVGSEKVELVPVKDLVPDALEFKGLGVNGTVRRYQKAPSPIPAPQFHDEIMNSATHEYEIVEKISLQIAEEPQLKRSISQNFVKDAIAKEIPKQENKAKNPLNTSQHNILSISNYRLNQPAQLPVRSSSPYLSPRALEALRYNSTPAVETRIPNFETVQKNSSSSEPLDNPKPPIKRKDEVSTDTLNDTEEITEDSSHQAEKFWFKLTQIFRSLSMAIHTWITTWPGLKDPRVIALNGKGLLIAVLTFATLDVFLALIKAFPKNFWCCWQVRNWDSVRSF